MTGPRQILYSTITYCTGNAENMCRIKPNAMQSGDKQNAGGEIKNTEQHAESTT